MRPAVDPRNAVTISPVVVADYARKSNKQAGLAADSATSESVERQHARSQAYVTEQAGRYAAEKAGWRHGGLEFQYEDDDVSGLAYAHLRGRERLIADAEAGKFQILVVSEQSRLGRDMVEVVYTIKRIIDSGVRIFAYLHDSEISTEGEQALMTMIRGYADQAQPRDTSKRVRDAALARVEAGHIAGAKIYGYDNVWTDPNNPKSRKVRRINEAQRAVVLRIFEDFARGIGSPAIAATLNAEHIAPPLGRRRGRALPGQPLPVVKMWSENTVRGILKNPIYIGTVVWGKLRKVVHRGKKRHESNVTPAYQGRDDRLRIISDDLWQRVQSQRDRRRRATLRSPNTGRLMGKPSWHDGHSNYLWTGYGQCTGCGGNIRVVHQVHGPKHARRKVRSYCCATRSKGGPAACANDVIVRHDLLDEALIVALTGVLDDRLLAEAVDRAHARLLDGHDEAHARRIGTEREMQTVQQRIDRLIDALADGTLPADEIKARLTAEKARKAALAAELDSLGHVAKIASLDVAQVKRDLRGYVADIRTLLRGETQEARAMLRRLLGVRLIDCTPVREGGRRGYRFRGVVALNHVLTGEALALASPSVTTRADNGRAAAGVASPSGTTGRDTFAANQGRGRCACGCRASGAASPR